MVSSSGRAGADQHDHLHRAQQPPVDHRAHAFEVEHAAGDQLAGVDPVVEGEAEALELLVEGEAEVVGEAVADRLAAIVVGEGEDPAQDRGAEQQERRVVERRACGLRRRRFVVEQAERAVDGIADQAGDRELEGRRHQGRQQRHRDPGAVAQRDPDDTPDDLRIARRRAALHAGIGAGIGARLDVRRRVAVGAAAV